MSEAGFEVASAYVALLIDDADFEAAVTEKIEAACAVGAANGGDVMTQGLAAAAAKSGDEIESALLEAVAGSGDAMAAQIGDGLAGGLGMAGSEAGEQFAIEFESAAADVGEQTAQEIVGPLTSGLAEAGAAGGEALGTELVASTETVGDVLASRISDSLRLGLDEAAQAAMGILGQVNVSGFAGTLASSVAGAGFLSSLTADLSDSAAEAGGAAGDALIAALADSAAQGAAGAADHVGEAVQASLADAMAQAGAAGGDALSGALDASAQEGVSVAAATAQQLAAVEQDAMVQTRRVVEQMAQGLPEPFISAYLAIRDGEEAAEEDLVRLSNAGQQSLQRLQSIVEQYGLAVADSAAATMQVNALAGMTSATPTMAVASEQAAAVGPQVAVPGLGIASESKAVAAGTEELAGAATAADAAVGGLGAAMGGPLMWGLLGVAGMLPMLSGLFNSSSQAAQAYTQQQQQLQQAISQDSNMIGANTVATIANQLATSGAADTLQGYGISLSEATSAMAGVSSVQTDVNGTLQNQIDNLQALISEQEASGSATLGQIQNEKQQLAQYQATHDAMAQLEQDVVTAVAKQNELTQATLDAEQAVDVFNVQVRAGVLALDQQAQSANVNAAAQSAYTMTLTSGTQAYKNAVNDQTIALANNAIQAQINALALNQSLPVQAQLSGEAVTAATAYQNASTATGAYTNALTALYGQYGQTSGAQAAFTTALTGLNGTITDGTNAVDLNTAAGSKNFTQFNNVAQAAETYAEKLYQQTSDAGQATQALQTMAGKLDDAATKAHLTAGQVQQLNKELFGVPDVKDIKIQADTSQATQAVSAFSQFIQGEIDSINAKPINLFLQGEVASVNSTPPNLTGGGRALSVSGARAEGGPVQAGRAYITGEQRPEVFVPESDGWIYPSIDEGRQALSGHGVTVHQHFYGTQWPDPEQTAAMHRELAAAVGVI